ncbi:MAG: hypothetical protein ACREEG_07390, partial [Phenylobacterium sp.]
PRLMRLAAEDQYAAMELFRGTMVRHTAVAYRDDEPAGSHTVDFETSAWLAYVPVRVADTIAVRENLPAGASVVLINRTHPYTDLYLPLDRRQEALWAAVDGRRNLREIVRGHGAQDAARDLFRQLWRYDQVVFDTSSGLSSDR